MTTQETPTSLIQDLTDLDDWIEESLNEVASRIWLPRTRRLLMAFKDDLRAGMQAATVKARAQTSVNAALKTTLDELQKQQQAALDKITELQNAPGAWTDQDIADIKSDQEALMAAFEPDAIIAAVVANTTAAAAGSAGSAAGAGQ